MLKSIKKNVDLEDTTASEILLVTPALAQKMLEKNESNRDIRQWRVKEFADAMSRGEWVVNNDAIGFNREGKLLNGQHRLHAIIASNTAQRLLIVHGLTDASQLTMDIGARRSYADHLAITGIGKYTTATTVAVRVLHAYLRVAHDNGTNGNFMDGYANNGGKPTFQQLDKVLFAHPGLHDAVGSASKAILRSRAAPALNGGVGGYSIGIYMCREAMIERNRDPQDFERGLFTGVDLQEKDPRLALRNTRRANRAWRQGPHDALLYMHAFNLWFQEERRGVVQVQERGDLIKPLGKLPKSCMPQMDIQTQLRMAERNQTS